MKIWIYTDGEGRIGASNPNNMTGNTGWSEYEDAPFGVEDSLTDENGVALYKLEDGEIKERLQEEREADIPKPQPPQPSYNDRLESIEQSVNLILSGEVE